MNPAATDFRDRWSRTVDAFPDRPAVVVAETGFRMSYAELHEQACLVAEELRRAEAVSGQLVGLRVTSRLAFAIGLLGSWLADAVPVPLSAGAPDAYVDRLQRKLGLEYVLRTSAVGPSIGVGRLVLTPSREPGAGDSPVPGLAYVMHTSGSTGEPKAVALSHRALDSYCAAFTATLDLSHEDRFLQLAPLTFDVVFEELLPIWSVGGTAVLGPETLGDPEELLAIIASCDVTVIELTTVYWSLLVRHLRSSGHAVPGSLRLLLAGGEVASPTLIPESLRLGLPLVHVYGVTEAAITSTLKRFDRMHSADRASRAGLATATTSAASAASAASGPSAASAMTATVGGVLPNSTVHIVDEAGQPQGPGTVGEVWIGGDGVAEGYLGNPEETSRRFVEVQDGVLPPGRYYRTGDAGRVSEDGDLEILGRLDAQVKISGIRVDLSEVEAHLNASPLVADSAVVAVRGADGADRLRAFVVPDPDADVQQLEQRLRDRLSDSLPAHLVPDRVLALHALPLTEHGKVDRARLAAGPGRPTGAPPAWAATVCQRTVVEAWTRAVGSAPTGPDQNFVDAGGSSLALLALVVSLEESGFAVSAVDFMKHPTVRSLATFIEGSTTRREPPRESEAVAMSDKERSEQRAAYLKRRRAGRQGQS